MYTFLVGLYNGYLKGDFHHICHQYLKTILLPCNVFDLTKIVQKVDKVVITLLGIADAVLLMYSQPFATNVLGTRPFPTLGFVW